MRAAKPRSLFHTRLGGFDLSRLLEQLIPAVIIGAVVIYATSKVMEYQIGILQRDMDRSTAVVQQTQTQSQQQSEKLAAITAQIAAYLGQQTALNSAIDARVTYLERERTREAIHR